MAMLRVFAIFTSTLLSGCVMPQERISSIESERVAIAALMRGERLLMEGALDGAEAAFSLALETSNSSESMEGLGCVRFWRGDLRGAKRYFEEALARDPENLSALGNLALTYDVEGSSEIAERIYVSVLSRDPSNPAVRNNRAALVAERRDPDAYRLAYDDLRVGSVLVTHPVLEENLKELDRLWRR